MTDDALEDLCDLMQWRHGNPTAVSVNAVYLNLAAPVRDRLLRLAGAPGWRVNLVEPLLGTLLFFTTLSIASCGVI